jgi:hypothetical protein
MTNKKDEWTSWPEGTTPEDAADQTHVHQLLRDAAGSKPVMPAYVFERHSDIERREDIRLVGMLIIDIPNTVAQPDEHHKRRIKDIVRQLCAAVHSGQLREDGLIVGWHGGARPANAADIDDDAVMMPWAEQHTVIEVRVCCGECSQSTGR